MDVVRRQFPTRQRQRLAGALCLVGFPASAQAHSANAGLGDFWNGVLHPVTMPVQVMILLGLGLLCGRRTPLTLKGPVLAFVSVSAAALAWTATGRITSVPPPLLITAALVPGGLLALDWDPPPPVLVALFAGAALLLGLDSAVDTGGTSSVLTTATLTQTLLGTWVALAVLIIDIPIYVGLGQGLPWLRIATRIAGSWIVAITLMMLAFHFRV